VWCGGLPVGPRAPDLKVTATPYGCSVHLPGLGSCSGGWWVWWPEVDGSGKPLADGGGHDVDDASGAVLLLEGDIEVYSLPT
jgi:hypothetical protein